MYKNKFIKACFIVPLIFQLFACNKTSEIQPIGSALNMTSISQQNDEIRVHFIDVGQADATLIEGNNYAVLIDAGNNDDGKLVVDYLKANKIKKIDAVIGTHPHEDHIGGLDDVINNFDVSHVYLPSFISNTKTFEDVLDAIAEKKLQIDVAAAGQSFRLGNMNFEIFSPGETHEDANDNSIVLRLTHFDNEFLFMGDAEIAAEKSMLTAKYNLKADVLKVGHHGSSTSTSDKFLEAVSPSIAIIPVGKDNSYGHPHQEIVDKLSRKNIDVYRTDVNSHIVIKSTNNELTIEPSINKSDKQGSNIAEEQIFIGNINSKKFHSLKCDGLPAEQNRTSFENREDAIIAGYTPCGNCHP